MLGRPLLTCDITRKIGETYPSTNPVLFTLEFDFFFFFSAAPYPQKHTHNSTTPPCICYGMLHLSSLTRELLVTVVFTLAVQFLLTNAFGQSEIPFNRIQFNIVLN